MYLEALCSSVVNDAIIIIIIIDLAISWSVRVAKS